MDLQNLITGCIVVEETVASIYRMFMDIFPDERIFWQDLYRDELEHSIWLSSGSNSELIDLLPSTDMMPPVELVNSTLAFLDSIVRHIKSNPVTLEEALKTALKIEKSMVEIFTNEITANLFATDYEALNNRLIAAEKLHVNKIEEMMIGRGFLQIS
jgi:rubrerythrin